MLAVSMLKNLATMLWSNLLGMVLGKFFIPNQLYSITVSSFRHVILFFVDLTCYEVQ